MNEQQQMEARLWEYIDGFCSEEEKTFVEKLIASNLEWRNQYEALLQFNRSLANNISLDEPSMRFTRNVMEEIARHHIAPATKSYINKNIIYGIGAFFLTLITGSLIYAIAQIDWTLGSNAGTKLPFNTQNLHLEKIFSNNYINAFMILNVVLGLMLLDRYLAQQKKDWKKQDNQA